ncbi:YlxR family protein [Mesomycoplasma bovoculi]|uniref:YlxR family protein n=1 Tax=Mesomycoplasma bovoculi M165/69 TaxID=743966 RepID=W5UTL0_9BACT|nr:YlxR family protein [Mesomycoplasma bovoculi]AHH45160.1 YlxR family protein [Mesomycoplasma bovoculi M165/69]
MNLNYNRKCIVCQQVLHVTKLLRFVYKNKQVSIDDLSQNSKISGRGAYVCKQEDQIALLFKKRLLNRSFKTKINSEIYEQLLVEVEKNGQKRTP